MECVDWIRFNERDDVIASTDLLALDRPHTENEPEKLEMGDLGGTQWYAGSA